VLALRAAPAQAKGVEIQPTTEINELCVTGDTRIAALDKLEYVWL
jgi:hypothetical protein